MNENYFSNGELIGLMNVLDSKDDLYHEAKDVLAWRLRDDEYFQCGCEDCEEEKATELERLNFEAVKRDILSDFDEVLMNVRKRVNDAKLKKIADDIKSQVGATDRKVFVHGPFTSMEDFIEKLKETWSK